MNVSNNRDPSLKSKYEKNMKIMEQKIRDNYKKAAMKEVDFGFTHHLQISNW